MRRVGSSVLSRCRVIARTGSRSPAGFLPADASPLSLPPAGFFFFGIARRDRSTSGGRRLVDETPRIGQAAAMAAQVSERLQAPPTPAAIRYVSRKSHSEPSTRDRRW